MVAAAGSLEDLERKAGAGERFTREDAARMLASPDLIAVGMVADAVRQGVTGREVTFGRVLIVSGGVVPDDIGMAGELRIGGTPANLAEAVSAVSAARARAGDIPVTGFTARGLFDLAGGDRRALVDAAARLRDAGLEAVGELVIDAFAETAEAIDVASALERGGLGVWRLTVEQAALDERLALAERAAELAAAVSSVRAFAPLPRHDPPDVRSTGYDDVRTVAVARVLSTARIQVDWPLYGPKLAQVALAYGASDIDGLSPFDGPELGPRRAPKADIERQIRAAGGDPVERDGRFGRRA